MAEINKLGLLELDNLTVTLKTVGENIEGFAGADGEIIRPVTDPYSKTGGIAVLKGNIAKNGCVVKRSAVAPEMPAILVQQEYLQVKKLQSRLFSVAKLLRAML